MILEVSVALMSPSLWGISIKRNSLEGDLDLLRSESLSIKFLGLLLQFTVYWIIEDED